jgi:tetratricopeptide (TPR) repeat protein
MDRISRPALNWGSRMLILTTLWTAASSCSSATPEEEARWREVRGSSSACAHARGAMLKGKRAEAALEWMECLATGDGSTPECYVATAHVLHTLGQPDDARAVLLAGQAEFRGEPLLYIEHAELLMALGFHRAAESELEESLVLAPNDARSWLLLGSVQLSLDQPTAALRALRRAQSLEGQTPELSLWMARTYRALGDDLTAADWYEVALANTLRAEKELLLEGALAFSQGPLMTDRRRVERAVVWADQALAQDRESDSALFVRGLLHERLGEIEAAQRCYEQATRINPAHREAAERLARLMLLDATPIADLGSR